MKRTVTLVDEQNRPLGEAEIVAAHTGGGQLHRAISVYVFDPTKSKLLVQKRSREKMLFAGIWANTCCSHPFKDEPAVIAGMRRLKEEMGIDANLTEAGGFVYRAEDPAGQGTEHEYDILLTGSFDPNTAVNPDPKEVDEWKWVKVAELQADMKKSPDAYAPWLHLGLPKLLS